MCRVPSPKKGRAPPKKAVPSPKKGPRRGVKETREGGVWRSVPPVKPAAGPCARGGGGADTPARGHPCPPAPPRPSASPSDAESGVWAVSGVPWPRLNTADGPPGHLDPCPPWTRGGGKVAWVHGAAAPYRAGRIRSPRPARFPRQRDADGLPPPTRVPPGRGGGGLGR